MKLVKAQCDSDWRRASDLLLAVVEKLDKQGASLWTHEQVSEKGLQRSYKLSELAFFQENENDIGVVFLQTNDPIFWPEIEENTTLFFHKLAINPTYSGKGKGGLAVGLIKEYAQSRQYGFLRVDCDDRQALRQFYSTLGFTFVEKEIINGFNVVKFELPL